MSDRVLVIGASHAGVQVAAAVRDGGHDGTITLIGAEPHLPYHRPPLSKAFLAGDGSTDGLSLRPRAFYHTKDIGLRLGERVTEVDLSAGVATTHTGARIGFDRLALATGARVRRLQVPGADLPGVVYVRALDDAIELRARLTDARRAVVVGGGFIGLEAAAGLAQRGIEVTVVEACDRLLARAVTPALSEWFARLHRERGVHVRCEASVTSIEGAGAVEAVVLDDGTRLPTDLVLVGIGVEPRTELAEQMGLRVARGIVVDDRARTSDPAVVATGDVTVLPHPVAPGTTTRLESVQNATDQSAVAASTLLGGERTYDAVPWFWSDQYDVKLQMAGAAPAYDDLVVRGSLESGSFSILAYRDGRLVGAECINAAADFVAVRRALALGVSPPAHLAADPEVRLKTLI
ncbi:NAD(P)/FAD-dependent oxidoreductase [Nocardioides massiliensis]|uniref:3-phenylpropionate/trans-cinnamate dioxygenase ferredoxin reductase subunit n=1 Tax=Nocardioides massiliensis TaxID=1325935 RepID=A0ABT9NNL9_9ACTN|nr:FAD-dependent oxidoreductase [Nocardioides massiliensis]MDP9821911.1 3-phenylpropionate/trans-cinnamate dioxygenase ferredoxin reductase subunit [Nocardioides massiliensis]